MSLNFLDFEQPIAELEAQIEELKSVGKRGELDINIEEEVQRLTKEEPGAHRKNLF